MNSEQTTVFKRKLDHKESNGTRPLYWGAKLPKLNRKKTNATDSAPSSATSSMSSASLSSGSSSIDQRPEISPTISACPVIVAALLPGQGAIPAVCIEVSKNVQPEPHWPLHRHPINEEQFERWWKSLKRLRGERKKTSPRSISFIEDSDTAAFGLQWLISALRPITIQLVEIESTTRLTPEECATTEGPLAFLDNTTTPTISIFHEWPSDDYIDANILKRSVALTYPASFQTTTRAKLSSLLVSLLCCDSPVLPYRVHANCNHFGFDLTAQWRHCMYLKSFFEATLAMCLSYYGVMDICGLRSKSWHHSLPEDEATFDTPTQLLLDLMDRLIPKRNFMVEDRLFMMKDMAFYDTKHLKTTEDLGREYLNFNAELFETYLSTKYHVLHVKVMRYVPFERCFIFMLERVRKLPTTWTEILSMVCTFIGVNMGAVISKYEFHVLSKQQRSVHLKLAYCPGGAAVAAKSSALK